MSTIMQRSAAKFWWGRELPKEIAYMYKSWASENWQQVTYSEIAAKKKAKQERILAYKRKHPVTKPGYVWVFYNDTTFFCGWWVYVKTLKEDFAINFKNPHSSNQMEEIMNLFPCGVIPAKYNFEMWAAAFYKTFRHEGFGRKKQGLAKCSCVIEDGELIRIT